MEISRCAPAHRPEAIRCYRAATEVAPASGMAWERLAWAYQLNRQGEEAQRASAKAHQLGHQFGHQGLAPWIVQPVPIHMDCWGHGGPCPPGTLPHLGGITVSSPNVEDLLRNAEIFAGPAGDQRIEIRSRPAQQQR